MQVLYQTLTHGTHHRGQLTTMLRQVGASAERLSVDPFFFYGERAQA